MDTLELLKSQLGRPLLERLGASVGLDAGRAVQVGNAILPAQARELSERARTPQGMQQLLGLAGQAPDLSPEQLSGDGPSGSGSLSSLRQSGAALLPQLMGDRLDGAVESVAAETGADRGSVRGMMQLLTPLVLRHFSAAPGGALGATLGAGAALGAAGLGAASLSGTGTGSTGTGSTGTGSAETTSTTLTAGGPAVVRTPPAGPPADGDRRSGNRNWLWWLLLLLLLLILGGCFLLRGRAVAPVAITAPAAGATVSGPFSIKGTGGAGQPVSVTENGQPVGTATVGQDGTFSANVPAPSAGPHTYTVSEPGNSAPASLSVTAAAPAPVFAVTSPANASSLPSGAFDLRGTGKPGDQLEVFEDGVSLGQVTVGADGGWSLNVPSPAAGAHTYTVKGPDGAQLGSVQATVAAGAASAAACTKPFSLSITDGQTVAGPFRFGGVGSGRSYTVTVLRGTRKIGSKRLPLDGSCGYSYTSGPGRGRVTYSVSPTGSDTVAGKITLNVR